jgi:hypothetical protein
VATFAELGCPRANGRQLVQATRFARVLSSEVGTKPRWDPLTGRSAVDGIAAVPRTHHPIRADDPKLTASAPPATLDLYQIFWRQYDRT